MRTVPAVVAVLAAGLAVSEARAATLLFIHAVEESTAPRRFTPADGTITATPTYDEGVVVRLDARDGTWLELSFIPPAGESLAPGSYQAVGIASGDAQARFGITGSADDCTDGAGTIVVHEATSDAGGRVLAFAADFTWRCVPSGRQLEGAVRFEVGDEACTPGNDGTPCDDRDPCTADDACQSGVCAGTDTVTPTCASAGACEQAGTCNPASGTCTAPTPGDGSCAPDGPCAGRPCGPGTCPSTGCDDDNPCTIDRCDETLGCIADPLPGCWNIAGGGELTISAVGSAFGHTARCTIRCQTISSGPLILQRGTYRTPAAGPGLCPSGLPFDAPEEVGDVVSRRGRLVLKPRNQADLKRAYRRCTGDPLILRRYRTVLTLDRARTAMTGASRLRIAIPGRFPTTIDMAVTFAGVPAGKPAPSYVPMPELPLCTPDLQPDCVVR